MNALVVQQCHVNQIPVYQFTASRNPRSGFSNIYQNSAIEEENAAGGSHIATSSQNSRRQLHDNDIDIDEKIHEENPYGDFYVNEETIPDIDVKNLSKLIKENSENEDDGFKKEYAVVYFHFFCFYSFQTESWIALHNSDLWYYEIDLFVLKFHLLIISIIYIHIPEYIMMILNVNFWLNIKIITLIETCLKIMPH